MQPPTADPGMKRARTMQHSLPVDIQWRGRERQRLEGAPALDLRILDPEAGDLDVPHLLPARSDRAADHIVVQRLESADHLERRVLLAGDPRAGHHHVP